MSLTSNEKSILNIIATDEMNSLNGSVPRTTEESATWLYTKDIAEEAVMAVNQVKGVLGSLVKKGILDIDDYDDDSEHLVQITKKGINELW